MSVQLLDQAMSHSRVQPFLEYFLMMHGADFDWVGVETSCPDYRLEPVEFLLSVHPEFFSFDRWLAICLGSYEGRLIRKAVIELRKYRPMTGEHIDFNRLLVRHLLLIPPERLEPGPLFARERLEVVLDLVVSRVCPELLPQILAISRHDPELRARCYRAAEWLKCDLDGAPRLPEEHVSTPDSWWRYLWAALGKLGGLVRL